MIQKTYRWKEITEDGLVKNPKDLGPSYSSDNLNAYGNDYESKDKAYNQLEKMTKMYPYEIPSNLTLITFYEYIEEEKW